MTETNDTTPAPRGASSALTFTVPVPDLLNLLAGGNLERGTTIEEAAENFFRNAVDHVAHELELFGQDMLSGEPDLGALESHLWRLGRMLRSAGSIAGCIRRGRLEVTGRPAPSPTPSPWRAAIESLRALRDHAAVGDYGTTVGEIVEELEDLCARAGGADRG